MPTEFADHQRKAMLRAVHEREGRWEEVDPDTEIARIGEWGYIPPARRTPP